MLYFAATIAYEQRILQKKPAGYFLGADDPYITNIVQESYDNLLKIIEDQQPSKEDTVRFTNQVRKKIKPLNTAGLLEPSLKNMYRHTAARL